VQVRCCRFASSSRETVIAPSNKPFSKPNARLCRASPEVFAALFAHAEHGRHRTQLRVGAGAQSCSSKPIVAPHPIQLDGKGAELCYLREGSFGSNMDIASETTRGVVSAGLGGRTLRARREKDLAQSCWQNR
jgi:hypothetical protein